MPRPSRMVLFFPAVCAIVASLSFPMALHAQGKGVTPDAACPPEGCIISVSVTPDGGTDNHPMNTGPWTLTFDARNTGNVTTPYAFTCSATGVTCGTVTPASASLLPGQEIVVSVTYSIGTIGGRVTLTANNFGGSSTNTGFFTITATNLGPPSAVTLRNQNGDNLDRSAGAGESAAAQCGDLLVTHSLPGFTTMNKERALTLIYNSARRRRSDATWSAAFTLALDMPEY